MAIPSKRARATHFLLELALERFRACEVCFKSEALEAIEDALRPLRLKTRELKRLLRRLTCPGCESQVSFGTLVVTYTSEQLQQARLSKRFDLLYADQLMAFRESLIEYPMLGAQHAFGRLLSKAMLKAKKTVLEPSEWFRATREIGEPKFQPRPSHESTKANRYNQIGQAAWYLAGDEKTAAVEVMREPKSGQPICVAKIRLLQPISVLDLRFALLGEDPLRQWIVRNVVNNRFISEPVSDVEDTRPECRVPQFIADLARRRGFRGILYDSTRPSAHNSPGAVGHNLVAFAPFPEMAVESKAVLEFGEPNYDALFSLERWPLKPLSETKRMSGE